MSLPGEGGGRNSGDPDFAIELGWCSPTDQNNLIQSIAMATTDRTDKEISRTVIRQTIESAQVKPGNKAGV